MGIAKITQGNSYGIWGQSLKTLSFLKPSWKHDRFKFTGKEELLETGYTDFGARLYDNLVSRFICISVLQAKVALQLTTSGQIIDNLILIGSPISDKSESWKQLKSDNIKNIIRFSIKGDGLSNPQGVYDFIKRGINNSPLGDSDHGSHFDAARPEQQTGKLTQTIIQWLQR